MIGQLKCLGFWLSCSVCLATSAMSDGIYTHWTAYTTTTASGVLGASSVSLTTDIADYSVFPSPVVGAVTNGTSTFFASTNFTPEKATADFMGLASASSFTLNFDPPVVNPTLQIYQLANNTLTFSDGTDPIVFTLLSSDNNFKQSNGVMVTNGTTDSTLTGIAGPTDSSGSLQFSGTFSRISWHSDGAITYDGIGLQISLSSPILSIQPTNNAGVLLSWPDADGIFTLQQNSGLNATNWADTSYPVSLVNHTNWVTIVPASGTWFFRLSQ